MSGYFRIGVVCLTNALIVSSSHLFMADQRPVFADDTTDDGLKIVSKKLEIANAKLAAAEEELSRLKKDSAKPDAIPLDLTDFYSTLAVKFDQAIQYPAWKAVPRGTQTFLNVPLQIGGCVKLWGEMDANNGEAFREHVKDIPVKRTFETLYVYHAAFYRSNDGDAVYEIVFHFSDGSTDSDQILYGDDIRDWYYNPGTEAIPLDPRSKLAWHGYYGDEKVIQPLRFCLTAVENPNPKLEVTSIDLLSCKGKSSGCVMAITTGKSGLLP